MPCADLCFQMDPEPRWAHLPCLRVAAAVRNAHKRRRCRLLRFRNWCNKAFCSCNQTYAIARELFIARKLYLSDSMMPMRIVLGLIFAFVLAGNAPAAEKALQVFFIDVEGGQSTLFVTSAGQSLLVD